MKHFLSRYKMLCECGAAITFQQQEPQSGVTAVRVRCGDCGQVNYGYLSADGAYRPRDKTLKLHWSILDVFAEIEPPMTVRQMYYQLSNRHAVGKTDSGYNKVQRALTDMRRVGAIPYYWLSDNSRGIYQTEQYRSVGAALQRMQEYYRRDLWETQNAHIEIWVEKRALVSQLLPICREYGVTLFPCGGYASISFAYQAACEWENIERPVYVYHLSDLDADGAYSSVALERELKEHAAQDIEFRRLALSPSQVQEFDLFDSLRPQKKTSTRYKWWRETYGDMPACEMDAIHPDDLRQLVRGAIERHIDPYALSMMRQTERAERESLAAFTAAWVENT